MSKEIIKRTITSFFLIFLLVLMHYYTFVLIISLTIIAIISWIEFYAIISKIINNRNKKSRILRFFYKAISLVYLFLLIYYVIKTKLISPELEMVIIYVILISIMSDLGGLIVGRTIKGKKLIKISPKKTISGAMGSFIFSLFLVPFFVKYFTTYEYLLLVVITLLISFVSQSGDLFISFLKRKAKVKDTSDLLPGHGGVLDRIDGIIFALPAGLLLFKFL
jgi:phosphatidate cytidylyltransferase